MAQANMPKTGSEPVVNEKCIFKSSWARYMNELFLRVGGGDLYNLGGRLTTDNTALGNVGGGEDDLIAYTLPKNTFHNDGDILEITAYGITAANGNNKTIKLILGSTTLFSTGAVAFNNKSWCLRAEITRTGSTAQQIITTFQGDFALLTNTATFVAGAEDFTTALTIKCTGTSGSSATDDIIQKGLIIKMFPAG
jgi:hypothetical protein